MFGLAVYSSRFCTDVNGLSYKLEFKYDQMFHTSPVLFFCPFIYYSVRVFVLLSTCHYGYYCCHLYCFASAGYSSIHSILHSCILDHLAFYQPTNLPIDATGYHTQGFMVKGLTTCKLARRVSPNSIRVISVFNPRRKGWAQAPKTKKLS